MKMVAVIIYMLPSVIGFFRWISDDPISGKRLINILVFDYLIGWLIIPWGFAMYWACSQEKKRTHENL